MQDTSVYHSRAQSITGSATVGPGAASGSINVSHQQINSDFASMIDQSGIKAGDEGFDVKVKGNTDLTGAVIASTDAAIDCETNTLHCEVDDATLAARTPEPIPQRPFDPWRNAFGLFRNNVGTAPHGACVLFNDAEYPKQD